MYLQIVGLYDVLLRAAPSPVIALNRAVAVAMRDGPEAGLALIDAVAALERAIEEVDGARGHAQAGGGHGRTVLPLAFPAGPGRRVLHHHTPERRVDDR